MSDSTPLDQYRRVGLDATETASATGRQISSSQGATALPREVRFRAALLGVALAAIATTLAVLIALFIVTGPFHTSLDGIA